MANAVVAVFDEYNEAQSAVNELLVAGFDKNEVRLSGEDGSSTTVTEVREERPKGIKGFFKSLFGTDRDDDNAPRIYDEAVRHGNYVVTAIARTDEKSDIASEVMSHHHPVDIDERSAEWLGQQNVQDVQDTSSRQTAVPEARALRTDERSIPVVEEEVRVGKREVQHGAVRIFQHISEIPIDEEVPLREEHVVVERVPVDRPASEADLGAFKEGSTEIRESAEEPVVSKTARVVEEVRVGKETTERKQKIKETARRTDVEVQRSGENDDYRAHFQQNYGTAGGQYDEYAPAYQYGSTAAGSRQFQGREWNEVEPDLQRDWEARNPGSKWERFKDSIRHAFSSRK
jgi:uncharacterized protein (TIGR02271 family)